MRGTALLAIELGALPPLTALKNHNQGLENAADLRLVIGRLLR
jgi:hypothetical protein